SADTTVPSQQELDLLFGPLYDEFFNDCTSRVNKSSSPTDNSIKKDTLPSKHIQPTSKPTTPTNVHAKENNDNQAEFINPFCTPVQENAKSSSRNNDPEMCMFELTVSIVEPKNIKEAMADSAWIEAMPEELHQFDRLQVWTSDPPIPTIQFLGDKLVSWMSKKQDCTVMSSAEAEYVALSASCAQVMWMRTQLQDYGFNYNKIPLYCYSQSAIAISCNPVQHTRTKHIHTRYHFIKEQVENGIIELYFVRTEYQERF
ncbi:hypothetical protein Tco_1521667, partial [Tanacetum coccineum]